MHGISRREPGHPSVPGGGLVTPLAKTFMALTGSQVLGKVVRFGYILIIARLLGPEDTAIYLYGLAVYLALGVIASFGQGVFLATRLGRGASTRRGLVRHSLTLRSLSTGLALGLGVIVVVAHAEETQIRAALVIFLCALVVRSLSDWMREWSTALEDAAWIPRYEIIFRGLEALIGSLALLLGAGVLTICLVHFAGRTLEAMAATRLMRGRHGLAIRFGMRRRLLYRISGVSLTLATGAGCLALFPQVSVVALKRLSPELADLAYFGIGLQVLMTAMIIPTVLGVAMLPAFGRMRRVGQTPDNANLSLLIRMALLSGAAIAVLADGYGAWAIGLALGADFAPVGFFLADLTWILGPYAATVLACQSLNAMGARRPAAIAGIAMVCSGLAIMMFTVPVAGLSGASLSFGLAVLAGCGLALNALRSRVAEGESRSWLLALSLTAGLGALMRLDLAPTYLEVPSLLFGAVVLSWRLRLLRRSEIAFLFRRFGFDSPRRPPPPQRIKVPADGGS